MLSQALYGTPWPVSFLVTILVTAILLLPAIIFWRLAVRFVPHFKYTGFGMGFGTTVLPLALWLYMNFFTDPLRALLFGFPGVFLLGIHSAAFGSAGEASHSIVVNPDTGYQSVLSTLPLDQILINIVIYGCIGATVDGLKYWKRNRQTTR